jgi:hypothetical protein
MIEMRNAYEQIREVFVKQRFYTDRDHNAVYEFEDLRGEAVLFQKFDSTGRTPVGFTLGDYLQGLIPIDSDSKLLDKFWSPHINRR